jgi:negative regulator of sigma-B (phosphoserine phosphatase)
MANLNFKQNFKYGIAERAMHGEEVSGDRSSIHFHSDGVVFAVIDGAGHGKEAASAAAEAAVILESAPSSPPGSLLRLCHEGLRSTRGAAISLVSIVSANLLMDWAGVGNVEVVLLRAEVEGRKREKEALLLRNGVVGFQFTQPRISTLAINQGDTLIFATDGISSQFLEGISLDDPCQMIADSIMTKYAKGSDDALVLVVQVINGAA